MIFRIFTIIVLLFSFDWYVYQAFAIISKDWTEISRVTMASSYFVITLLFLFFSFLNITPRVDGTKRKSTFRAILMLAYFSKFLILVVLLTDDVRLMLIYLFDSFSGLEGLIYERSKRVAQLAVTIGFVPFFILSYGIIRNPFRYKVFREEVIIDDLAPELKGLKIIQISDIHSGSFRAKEPIRKAIELINKEEADFVFFTGDIVNSVANEMEEYIDVFDKISAKFGVFSILGNHDYGDYVRWDSLESKQKNFKQLLDIHRRLGWDLMLNENRLLDVNGVQIAIIGVENYSARARFTTYGNMEKASLGTEHASLKLLLSHDPSHWEDEILKEYKDVAITFSGHTHGFQFGLEIPGWIKWSPSKYIYKQWAGLYQEGKQFLYVNRGFGVLAYPGRVGILPEITIIQLS